MIIKGKARSGAKELAAHLKRTDTNERVTVLEIANTIAKDVKGALLEMELIAGGTSVTRFMYHAQINVNTYADEALSVEQWKHAADKLGERLGFTKDYQRVIVMHEKKDRQHVHVVWNRVDPATMGAHRLSHNYRAHEEVARDLEREFGHARVQGAHAEREGVPRPERRPDTKEWKMQEATGVTIADVKKLAAEAWRDSKTGAEFRDRINDAGFVLARGDRRDFVLVDHGGGVHGLGRRLTGIKAQEVRAKMSDIDLSKLPSIDQAKEMQKLRETERVRTGDGHGMSAEAKPKLEQKPSKWTQDKADQFKADKAVVATVLSGIGKGDPMDIINAANAAHVVFAEDDKLLYAVTARHAFKIASDQTKELRNSYDTKGMPNIRKAKATAYVMERHDAIADKTREALLLTIERSDGGKRFHEDLKAVGLSLKQDQWKELHVTDGRMMVALERIIPNADKRELLPALDTEAGRKDIETFKAKFRHITEEMRVERNQDYIEAMTARASNNAGYKAAAFVAAPVRHAAHGISGAVGMASRLATPIVGGILNLGMGVLAFFVGDSSPRVSTAVRRAAPIAQRDPATHAREYLARVTPEYAAKDPHTALLARSGNLNADLASAIRRQRESQERERD